MAQLLFVLPKVEPGDSVRLDTASGSNSPATVYAAAGGPVIGPTFHADPSGVLPRVYGAAGVTTLYLKHVDYRGTVTGSPVTVTGGDAAPAGPSSPGASTTLTDRGNWATTTVYAVGDVVTQSGQRFIANTAHTAGGTFAGDSAKWTSLDAVVAMTQATADGRYDTIGAAASAQTAAQTYAAAQDTYQRLITYYGIDPATGLPNKPWQGAAGIGSNLWALGNFTSGGNGFNGTANTSTLTPSATTAASNVTTTTRILVPDGAAANTVGANGGGESNYSIYFRIRMDVTVTGTPSAGYFVQIAPKDSAGAATLTQFNLLDWNNFATAPNGHTVVYEGQFHQPAGNAVRYLDIQLFMPGGTAGSGTLSISNVSVYPVGSLVPLMRAAWDRTPGTNAKVICDMPVGTDEGGNLRWVRETFQDDNAGGTAIFPAGAIMYQDAAFQTPGRVDTAIFSNYPTHALHGNNSADVITVKKTDNTYELRGNTHGGEAGQSGTFTTDNQFFVDYGDGAWTQVTSYDRVWHWCRRVKIVVASKLTRSDQTGTPFANITRTYYVYADGTVRVDKTIAFLQDQQISKWFYHMTSQDTPANYYHGRLGRGQQVIGSVDYGTKLAAPTPSSPTASTTGGVLAAGTYSVRITALNQYGETTASIVNGSVTTTGSTGSIGASWGAVSGATAYNVYFGPAGFEDKIATVTSGTTYTITGSETPTGVGAPTRNTAYTGAVTSNHVFRADADWSAIRERVSGGVMSLALDKANILGLGNGVSGISAELTQSAGSITKNYWVLNFANPAPTISNGSTFASTLWFFYYYPADPVNFEKEQTYRAGSVANLPATLYPST